MAGGAARAPRRPVAVLPGAVPQSGRRLARPTYPPEGEESPSWPPASTAGIDGASERRRRVLAAQGHQAQLVSGYAGDGVLLRLAGARGVRGRGCQQPSLREAYSL